MTNTTTNNTNATNHEDEAMEIAELWSEIISELTEEQRRDILSSIFGETEREGDDIYR